MHDRTSRASLFPLGLAFALLLSLGDALPSRAQEAAELVTDRPDQTESTDIVPLGAWQLEAGILLERDEAGGEREESLALGSSLLRIGLTPKFELRIGWDGLIDSEVRGGAPFDERGAGDASLGFKLALRQGDGLSPAVAVIVTTTLPVGDDAFTSDELDPSVRLSVSHSLSDAVAFGWNVGVARESSPAGSDEVGFYTASVSRALGERLGGFVELFGDIPFDSDGDPEHSFDAGIVYLLRPNLQLDLAAGLGLNDDAPDFFAGVGISWRWPR
jgi:hypothetical protein